MFTIPSMILIGGNSRHSGKTTLACHIIGKFSGSYRIIGLKVTSIRPGEEIYHGNHNPAEPDTYKILEEKNPDTAKDTSLMLKAGADKVFYIQARDEYLSIALQKFLKVAGPSSFIVCESRSLRKFVNPGIFFMMIRPESTSSKPLTAWDHLANVEISDAINPQSIGKIVENISIASGVWQYSR